MTTLFFIPAHLVLMYSVYLVGIVSPGPSNMTIMAAAVTRGRIPALALACGVITGSITWGILAGFGLATVLSTWTNALIVLKIVGGIYLLWLGYRAARSASSLRGANNERLDSFAGSKLHLYLRGVAMHLTNPKAIFSWVATISVGLPSGASPSDVLIALSGCFCLSILTFSGYSVVFSTAVAQRVYAASRRWVEGTIAAVYGLAGVKLWFTKVQ